MLTVPSASSPSYQRSKRYKPVFIRRFDFSKFGLSSFIQSLTGEKLLNLTSKLWKQEVDVITSVLV